MAKNRMEEFLEWNRKQNQNGTTVTDYITPVQEAKAARKTTGTSSTGSGKNFQDFINWNRQQNEEQAGTDINSWISASNGLLNRYGELAGSWRARNDAAYDDFNQRKSRLLSYAQNYRQMYQGNDDAINAINSVVNALSDTDLRGIRDYWSQWDSAEQYNTAKHNYDLYQKYNPYTQEQIDAELAGMDQQNPDRAWLEDYSRQKKYLDLDKNADFAANSGYESTKTGEARLMPTWDGGVFVTDTGYGDILYDYINRNQDAIDTQNINDINSYATRLGVDKGHLQQMTDDQIARFNYLYKTQSSDAAYEYIKSIEPGLNALNRQKEMAYWEEYAGKHPVISSGLSFVTNLDTTLSFLGQVGDYLEDGQIDQNAGYNRSVYITNTIRGAADKVIQEKWGPVGSFLYQNAMSIGDQVLRTFLSGGYGTGLSKNVVEQLTLLTMASGASASMVVNAKDRGLDETQTIALGVIAGAAEYISEKIGFDALFNANLRADSVKKYLLKNMASEGLEEFVSGAANLVADLSISGDRAEVRIRAEEIARERGISIDEAFGIALGEQALEIGKDMLGGAFSGGLMAGVSSYFGYHSSVDQTADVDNLIRQSLEINPDNQMAKDIQAKFDAKQKVTPVDIDRLQGQYETDVKNAFDNDRNLISNAAATRLGDLGETGDVNAIAQAIGKYIQNRSDSSRAARNPSQTNFRSSGLTGAERQLILNSRYGQQVLNELNTNSRIQANEQNRRWTGEIGTRMIRPEMYGRFIQNTQTEQTAPVAEQQTAAPISPDAWIEQQAKTGISAIQAAPAIPTRQAAPQSTVQRTAQAEQNDTETETVTVEDASAKYGKQAGAFIHTYQQGQDIQKYDAAYQAAYDYGKASVPFDAVKGLDSVAYLTETQRRAAYEAGNAAADTEAEANYQKRTGAANGKTGRRKGTVKGVGVKIADINEAVKDQTGRGYRVASTVAEATGIDIVFYKSELGEDGKYHAPQGVFASKSPDTLYIDINAGLMNAADINDAAKYMTLRTFTHEFSHFIEYWNPVRYNELRKVVFQELTNRGENVNDLIETKMATGNLTYDAASREVVAESLTDILPDTKFVQNLAEKHRSIFNKLLEKLKEFAADIRAYFNTIGQNRYRGANALKEQIGETTKYIDSIIEVFDRAAEEAVETFQNAYAVEEDVQETVAQDEKQVKKQTVSEETIPATEDGTESFNEQEKRLYNKLATAITTIENGFEYRVGKLVNTGEYIGSIYRVTGDAVPVLDARPLFVGYFKTAQEAARNVVEVAANNKLLDVKEETKNGESAVQGSEDSGEAARPDNDGAVQQSAGIRETPARLLDGIPAEDVQRNGGRGDTIGDGTEPGENAGRGRDGQYASAGPGRSEGSGLVDGARAAAGGDGGRPGRNDGAGQTDTGAVGSVSGDEARTGSTGHENPRRERNRNGQGAGNAEQPAAGGRRTRRSVTAEEKQAKAETLQQTVSEQIEQQSTVEPKGSNFVIGDSLNLPNGEKARINANIDAIRLIKQLETEGRYATAAEQETLSKYVGWGGLSNAFGELRWNSEARKSEMVAKKGWEKEFEALRQLVTDGTITEEEYQAMSASTKNAHYTSIEVIKAMYDGLSRLGFTGGRMLEPSSGVGNFVGAMPAAMSRNVKSWTMVELDRITGQIAKYLYPNADVRIQGFETANIPDNYMDVAIGNVPFGNYGVVDRSYPKRITKAIHNYFFAKTLDKVRTGGIVMFITSSFTMNGKDSDFRQYMMKKADLLGAIRLPNTAFSGNAGTQVVTDILVLKKRAPGTEYTGEAFLEAPYRKIGESWQGAYVNEYFDNHPEMVLGTPALERGMYSADSLTYNPLEGKGTLGEQIREAFTHIQGKMDYQAQATPEKTNYAVERANRKTKQNGLEIGKDGKLYRNINGTLEEVSDNKDTISRVAGLLAIRDAYRNLASYLQQDVEETYIQSAREALNKAYDDFVEKYGYINTAKNKAAIEEDPDKYSIYSLENYDPDTKTATKADIFTKNTIGPNRTVNHVDDISSGVIVSINQTGGIDPALIASLTGSTEESVTRELIDSRLAFKTKDGGLEAPETYLAGNVRAKLREAEALAPLDKDYQNNVEELKKIIPKDVPFNDIYVSVGTPWVPNNVYADFIAEMLGGYNRENSYSGPDVTVGRNINGEFKIVVNNARLKGRYQNTQKWGTKRRTFLELMTAMMSNGSLTVNDTYEDSDGRKRSVPNKLETDAAHAKAEEITKEFQDWLWRDENRKKELASLYNETFNALVTPKYNGENLTVNGLNTGFTLRAHQANAVQRIIASGGNTLLAHKVGAGKTLEMAAAAMKLRELGIVKKPMFVVPKSLVAQWGNEFKSYFPAARLFVADEKSFVKAKRKVFSNQIANGDYDAIILSYEQFEKIPLSNQYLHDFYQDQINEIIDAIAEEKAESRNGKGITVKEMEKMKARLEKKQADLTTKEKDVDNIDFDMLGVDSLFVDEAHNFKNLAYITHMNNVAGLGNRDGSQRAFDLYTKIRYLQGLNGGRGIVFATATPVMNSMAELYIMQKYLQSDVLEQLGLKTFDAWAKQFGEIVNSIEVNPSGVGFRQKQTFSNFRNLNELQLLFRSFSDVLTQVPGLEIPKMKGGKVKVIQCEPGQFQKDYMEQIQKRADNIKNVDPSEDNMLKITSDGKKVSYTQRMIDPSLPYEQGCKIFRCCDNVLTEYKESQSILGTQIIFCDMATPKGQSNTARNTDDGIDDTAVDTSSARLYDDMKAYLVKRGIPSKEIAFIHDADTNQKRAKLFEDVNDGKVRVLIGSTGKMGVGMNAQKRIVAIHHLDAPWRPGDVEQRDGRAFRQKNMNKEVSKYTYVTKGSFDARLWDILDRKQNFINQIMNGNDVGRSAEDTGDVTISAAEVKALALNDPEMKEFIELGNEVQRLQNVKRAYQSSITAAKSKMLEDEQRIKTTETAIQKTKQDIQATRKDTYSEGKFSMKIGNSTFTEKKDAGAALAAAITAKAKLGSVVPIGTFAGFEMRVLKTGAEYTGYLSGVREYPFNVYMESTTRMVNQIISVVEGLENKVTSLEGTLSELQTDLEAQKGIIAAPFARQAEFDQKTARYNELMQKFNPKEEQTIGDEDTVQEQSRDYPYPEGDDVQYQIRYPEYTEDDIRENSIALQSMDPVGHYTGNELGDRSLPLKQRVTDFFNSLGNNVYTEQFGDVALRASSVRSEFRHGNTPPKAVTYASIPKVLNGGRVINVTKKSDNGSERIVVAAPISIGTPAEKMFVAVMLQRDPQSQRLYLHDAVTEKEFMTSTDRHLNPTGLAGTSDKLFTTDILLNALNVKPNAENSQQYQDRTTPLSNREVLSMAANDVRVDGLNAGEIDALNIYKKNLDALQELEEKRQEEGRKYKEQQFGAHVDRAEAQKTLNRMKVLDDQINKANEKLLDIEQKEVLKRVLQQSRKVIEQAEREHGREILRRYRDRQRNAAQIKKYRERIQADTAALTKWILHPNNKNAYQHVPDALKNSVIPFLTSIDFTSKRQLNGGEATKADRAFLKNMQSLRDAIKQNMDVQGMYSGYSDLPEDFMENMQRFIDAAQALADAKTGQFIINRMTADELQSLSKLVRTVKTLIVNMNAFHQNAMFQHAYDAGNSSIQFMRELNDAKRTGLVSDFLLWQQMRPAYAFERFGEGGKSIYDEFRQGQATLAFDTNTITAFTEKAYTDEEVKTWEKETKTFELGGEKVEIPVSYLMGLYELSKRPQALTHILGGGLRVATYKNGKEKIADVGHALTAEDVTAMIQELTPRQMEVADSLQRFMAQQGGEWGNYVSVARFGEELFGEENYYPISSDGRHLKATADESPSAASLYALLNMSFTKELKEGANNRIVLYSIFDVFANHMASMAQYHSFALPILDSLKWLNYQQVEQNADGSKTVLGSVREQMARAYGTPEETRPGKGRSGYAEDFVLGIIKAFNGTETQGIPTDNMGLNAMHRYNMAQVAYNARVVMQQPLAITRAGLLVDYKNIIRGMKLTPAAIRANIAEMQKYSGIAAWKALGFYDVNISRGLTDIIKHNKTFMDKVGDIGMAGAEMADTLTWQAIWSACKEQVKRRGVQANSNNFYTEVTKLFEDVIYKTQVVDSVLTKNEFLRSKGSWTRLVGSFMSEPTTTASMLIDAFDKFRMDKQRGMNNQQAWKKNSRNIVRTTYVYAVGALLLAVVTGVADAWRDDDDYKSFLEKWLAAFKGNIEDELNPVNKLPIMRDFYELVKSVLGAWGVDTYGNEPRSVIFQWRDYLVKASEIFHDKLEEEKTNYTWYGGAYKLLQAASGITGLPLAAATREIISAWNNTIGGMAPSLKVKTYDSGAKNNIKYAYQDGTLTEDVAIQKLIDDAGMTQADAKAQVTKWKYAEWDTNGGGLSQEEVAEGLEKGTFTEQEKQQIWKDMGFKKDLTTEVKEKAKARVELDENAVVYNSANWQDGLKDTTLSNSDKDKLVTAYGGNWFAEPYMTLRKAGYTPSSAYDLLVEMDTDKNKSIKQAEAYKTLIGMSDQRAIQIWNSFGWKTDWQTYKARQH